MTTTDTGSESIRRLHDRALARWSTPPDAGGVHRQPFHVALARRAVDDAHDPGRRDEAVAELVRLVHGRGTPLRMAFTYLRGRELRPGFFDAACALLMSALVEISAPPASADCQPSRPNLSPVAE